MRPGLRIQASTAPLEFLANSRTRFSTSPYDDIQFSNRVLRVFLLLVIRKRTLDTYSHQAITTHHPRLFSLVSLSVGTADIEKPQRFRLLASRELGKRFDASNSIL